jgi:hypothetical protein
LASFPGSAADSLGVVGMVNTYLMTTRFAGSQIPTHECILCETSLGGNKKADATGHQRC